jgi:microcystin-dependent protein
MPCHSHGYQKFYYDSYWDTNHVGHYHCPTEKDRNFFRSATTDSCGGSQSHNNMPPFLTANCWKRTG